MTSTITESLRSLRNKQNVTLLVTDSGLGGLAVFAAIAARLEGEPVFPDVSLIYYNAWPEQDRGYHRLKGTAERIRVFDQALLGMARFDPDIILIACNTLSVLYPQTEFFRRQSLPVVDIVGFGVDMIYEYLCEKPDATAMILGTITTIRSGVHRVALMEKGISPEQVVVQACDQLATAIEKGPAGDRVAQLIDTYTDEAAQKLGPNPNDVVAALCCTHFGYCRDQIQGALEQRLRRPVAILDPNERMADFLFTAAGNRIDDLPLKLNLRVVSRIIWEQTKIDAIATIIEKTSGKTAQALRNYEQIPELFALT